MCVCAWVCVRVYVRVCLCACVGVVPRSRSGIWSGRPYPRGGGTILSCGQRTCCTCGAARGCISGWGRGLNFVAGGGGGSPGSLRGALFPWIHYSFGQCTCCMCGADCLGGGAFPGGGLTGLHLGGGPGSGGPCSLGSTPCIIGLTSALTHSS